MASIPTQIAETVQTAHIQRNPSPNHDINPSTAASAKEPVRLSPLPSHSHHGDLDDDRDDISIDSSIPLSVLKPRSHARSFPPMPDLRFEQSYLHSIEKAQSVWGVAWITIMMPFAQGIAYNLLVCGWQYWNKNAQLSGNSIGARARRWWYGVNNWPLPHQKTKRS
ncbi:hypothetical protein F5Y15DRAFT_420206 [Xylariaceae sp. FL0016]|nr:hypothetical protein F5Y15DRAFT_420206 [Xylariaceae sp. FL0016]